MPGMPLFFMTSLAIESRLAIALSIWPSGIGTPAVCGGDVSARLGIGALGQSRQKTTSPVANTFLVGRSAENDFSKDMMRHSGVQCCRTWFYEQRSCRCRIRPVQSISLPERLKIAGRV